MTSATAGSRRSAASVRYASGQKRSRGRVDHALTCKGVLVVGVCEHVGRAAPVILPCRRCRSGPMMRTVHRFNFTRRVHRFSSVDDTQDVNRLPGHQVEEVWRSWSSRRLCLHVQEDSSALACWRLPPVIEAYPLAVGNSARLARSPLPHVYGFGQESSRYPHQSDPELQKTSYKSSGGGSSATGLATGFRRIAAAAPWDRSLLGRSSSIPSPHR